MSLPVPLHLPVSLEPHLQDALRPLADALPAPLSAELSPLLLEPASSSTPTISYALLRSISRWARTEEGAWALRSKDPPLDPLAYSIVALLAGTRTSPGKKFPPPSRPSENPARDISDKRAILAVLNALLSVICTGAAVWWAAQRTGWRDEWKVLLSLLAAIIVAISEVGLYMIWESRRRKTLPTTIRTDRELSDSGYSVSNAESRDVPEHTSSRLASLGDGHSQASTSVDPHEPNARIALRQRLGTTTRTEQ
ncbi:hypothetical protein F5148DRAFT_1280690 [Russula earlei]|uniref:Uncharacterized protein n=1 Tax=Russula earlei TaxID=71964 RepID=A0ACC0UJ63_9AGAM|nr:hypothetical protein F5148DRAFT_1280690 [Russula earlei]